MFGLGGAGWDGVRVLERYELLYELGLLAESPRPPAARRRGAAATRSGGLPCSSTTAASWPPRWAGCGAS